MARVVVGLVVGILLVFPGVELIRFFAAQLFGAYDDMTLTEACLAMIIILQAIILLRGAGAGNPAAARGEAIVLRPRAAQRRPSSRRVRRETPEPPPTRPSRSVERTTERPERTRAAERSRQPRRLDREEPRSPRRPSR